MFRLYWLDTRTGDGYPVLAFPNAMTYDEARKIVQQKQRHPTLYSLEMHLEPEELFNKFTIHHEPK